MALNITDVRAAMPNFQVYKDWQRSGNIVGIAVHHSATASRDTGEPVGDAYSFFNYHVNTNGWAHGGYNYVINGSGEIQYALDEKISAYHAGFKDPDNSEGLEHGQYWNNHYIAICMSGWFTEDRTYVDASGRQQKIPNNFTAPSPAQMRSLLELLQHLRAKYNIAIENVRGHRELLGNSTVCPGHNFDPASLRQELRRLEQPPVEPDPSDGQPQVNPGEHVVLLPDTDQYLNAAMTYIWKFQPVVSFAIEQAVGRWRYVTAVGSESVISNAQLEKIRNGGAELVQRIPGAPAAVQVTFDQLVQAELRFLEASESEPEPEPPPAEWPTYTIQPGDTLSKIAGQFYGSSALWRIIFDANRNILSDPSRIRPGQVLKIPPKPE